MQPRFSFEIDNLHAGTDHAYKVVFTWLEVSAMKRLWIIGGIVVATSFAVLGWIGSRIYQEMPPIPDRVVTADGVDVIPPGESFILPVASAGRDITFISAERQR
jgi:hypothetical protein